MPYLVTPSDRAPGNAETRWSLIILPAAAVAAAICGLMAGYKPVLLLVPVLLVTPVILWRRPHYGVIFLVGTATVIENFKYTVGSHQGVFTSRIPWWRSFTHGMILFPVEIFILLLLLIWIMKSGLQRSLDLPRSPIMTSLKFLWVLLVVATGVGLAHGAHLKNSLWELRSFLLLSVAYILAATLLKTRRAFQGVLWTLVLGTGFKGVQGTIVFFSYARKMRPRPEVILGHEEALFFTLFIIITIALWLYGIRGWLRTTATCLLPFVFIADLANSRRVAWLILLASIAVMFAITLPTLPERRRFLRRTLVVLLALSAIYFPAYWNHNGTLAQPARAIHSAFHPDARDKSSDQYRQQENVNLLLNIKSSGPLGRGFGVPINYSVAITDISGFDNMIAYIPHNGVLWIWMRLGIQGEIVFWCFIVAAIIKASRLARAADRQLAFLGGVITCSIIGYVLMGYNDMGFAFFRIAVVMGTFLGVVESASRLAEPLILLPEALPLDDQEPRSSRLGRAQSGLVGSGAYRLSVGRQLTEHT